MSTELSKNQWIIILRDKDITRSENIELLQTIYSHEDHKAYHKQLVNRIKDPRVPVDHYADRIYLKYSSAFNIELKSEGSRGKGQWWLFFNGWLSDGSWVWSLKPNLVAALAEILPTGDGEKLTATPSKINQLETDELPVEQWIAILQDTEVTKEKDVELFQALYSFNNHQAYASQIGRLLGYTGINTSAPLNTQIGRYARRIEKKYHIPLTHPKYPCAALFFDGWSEGRYFLWLFKKNLLTALREINMTGIIDDAIQIPDSYLDVYPEGAKHQITVNVYERNPIARRRCIEVYGAKCVICDFDFFKVYGDIGKDFIQIHHIVPLNTICKEYDVDPINDLVPVCPNCHSMIHRKKELLSIAFVKKCYLENKQKAFDN